MSKQFRIGKLEKVVDSLYTRMNAMKTIGEIDRAAEIEHVINILIKEFNLVDKADMLDFIKTYKERYNEYCEREGLEFDSYTQTINTGKVIDLAVRACDDLEKEKGFATEVDLINCMDEQDWEEIHSWVKGDK